MQSATDNMSTTIDNTDNSGKLEAVRATLAREQRSKKQKPMNNQ